MHLRMVLRSIPSSRAIAETVSPLAMKIKNHDDFPIVHRSAPSFWFWAEPEGVERYAAPPQGAFWGPLLLSLMCPRSAPVGAGLQLTFDVEAERLDSLFGVEVHVLPAIAIIGLQLFASPVAIFHVRLRTDAIASP
jgi:hypothetical protein